MKSFDAKPKTIIERRVFRFQENDQNFNYQEEEKFKSKSPVVQPNHQLLRIEERGQANLPRKFRRRYFEVSSLVVSKQIVGSSEQPQAMKTRRRQYVSEDSLTVSRRNSRASTSRNAKQDNSETISTYLITEILLRLPGKSVARSRCVSKLWNSTLRSPYFTELFLTMSLTRPRLLFSFRKELKVGVRTGECRHYEMWVLEDAETHEWSKNVSVLPLPLWKSLLRNGELYFAGVAGGSDEVVLWPRSVDVPFYVYYYNMERNTFRRVEIKGLDAAIRYYGGCMTLDYVEDVKLAYEICLVLTCRVATLSKGSEVSFSLCVRVFNSNILST